MRTPVKADRTEAMNTTDEIAKQAVNLATQWQNRANALQTPQEKMRHAKLARLFTNPKDKVILTQLIDQSFRSSDFRRVANQIHYILTRYGIPTFFSPFEKFLMLLFMHAGRFLPRFTVPRVIDKIWKWSVLKPPFLTGPWHLLIPNWQPMPTGSEWWRLPCSPTISRPCVWGWHLTTCWIWPMPSWSLRPTVLWNISPLK